MHDYSLTLNHPKSGVRLQKKIISTSIFKLSLDLLISKIIEKSMDISSKKVYHKLGNGNGHGKMNRFNEYFVSCMKINPKMSTFKSTNFRKK